MFYFTFDYIGFFFPKSHIFDDTFNNVIIILFFFFFSYFAWSSLVEEMSIIPVTLWIIYVLSSYKMRSEMQSKFLIKENKFKFKFNS